MISEEQIQEQRLVKQTYLREEVLNKGYDVYQFMEYLESIKENGQNVDNWELQELKECVSEFVRIQNMNTTLINNNDYDYYQQTNQTILLDKQQEQNNFYSQDKNQYQENNIKFNPITLQKTLSEMIEEDDQKLEFECKKLNNPLQISQIKIKLGDPEVRSAGLFGLGGSYTVYKINSDFYDEKQQIQNFQVYRRFSDFSWLRQVLKNCFPANFVPSLFKKKTKKTTDLKQKKRLLYLSQFLEDIVQNVDFRQCPYLQAFLQKGEKQNGEFQKIQYRGKEQKEIQSIQSIVNATGKVKGSISEEKFKFIQTMDSFTNQAEPVYNNLKRLSKRLIVDLDNISSTFIEIGNEYKTLFEITNNSGLYNSQYEKLNEIYVRLNNFSIKFGDELASQIENVQDNLYNQLKYSCRQFDSYREILKKTNEEGTKYLKFKEQLLQKKERLYTQTYNKKQNQLTEEDLKKKQQIFETMLPDETINLEKLKNHFSYFNNQCYLDMNKQVERKLQSYQSTYTNLFIKMKDIENEISGSIQEIKYFFLKEINLIEQDNIIDKIKTEEQNKKLKSRPSIFESTKKFQLDEQDKYYEEY